MTEVTKRTKNFGGRNKKATPMSFTLMGEEFDVRPRIIGVDLIEFAAAATSEDTSTSTAATLDFFRRVMTADEHKRFDDYIRDPDREVDVAELAEIVAWLVEQYTSRPTE